MDSLPPPLLPPSAPGNPPGSLTDAQLDKIQGDVWSKGFPKNYETYYFFSIVKTENEKFAECLQKLAEHDPPLISSLRMVSGDRTTIRRKRTAFQEARKAGRVEASAKAPQVPISNALIAFTYRGLLTLQGGEDEEEGNLDLYTVKKTDPAFAKGMFKDGEATDREPLNDPKLDKWDTLFQSPDKIHGLLKVAGNTKEQVETHLKAIQTVLLHGTAIVDVPGDSAPTPASSRIDGWVRPNDRGKEHFGFKDGISQPLMAGIDQLEPDIPSGENRTNMNTLPDVLIVSEHTHAEARQRPDWMYNGSFLVVRKLQQNVKGFEELTDRWQTYNCDSKSQMGAKLMGRYQSGAPIALPEFHQNDKNYPDPTKGDNDFGFTDLACPISAHIRKTNLRVPFGPNSSDRRGVRTRIIRSGISYGTDYEGNENDTARGLIFACYQGHIEDGFLNMQGHWSNNAEFPEQNPGQDPIVGQVPQTTSGENGNLKTVITDKTNTSRTNVEFSQLVTLKGGEYFFVPSIPASKGDLAHVRPED